MSSLGSNAHNSTPTGVPRPRTRRRDIDMPTRIGHVTPSRARLLLDEDLCTEYMINDSFIPYEPNHSQSRINPSKGSSALGLKSFTPCRTNIRHPGGVYPAQQLLLSLTYSQSYWNVKSSASLHCIIIRHSLTPPPFIVILSTSPLFASFVPLSFSPPCSDSKLLP